MAITLRPTIPSSPQGEITAVRFQCGDAEPPPRLPSPRIASSTPGIALRSVACGLLRDSPAALGARLVNLPNAIPMQTRDRLAREGVAVVCRPCTLLAGTLGLTEDRAGLVPSPPPIGNLGRQGPAMIALITPSEMLPEHSRLAGS